MKPTMRPVSFPDAEPHFIVLATDSAAILHRGALRSSDLFLIQVSDDVFEPAFRYFPVGALNIEGQWVAVQIVGDESALAEDVVVFKAL